MNAHPSLEQLSTYVETPDSLAPDLREHIEGCPVCAAHLAQLHALDRAVVELSGSMAPSGQWAEIRGRLADRGIIESERSRSASRFRFRSTEWGLAQLAAAATVVGFVFLGGLLTGRATGDSGSADLSSREHVAALVDLLPTVEDTASDSAMADALVTLGALEQASRTALAADPLNTAYGPFTAEIERRARRLERAVGDTTHLVPGDRRTMIEDSVLGLARKRLLAVEGMRETPTLLQELFPQGLLESDPNLQLGARLEPLNADLAAYFPGTDVGVLVLEVYEGSPLKQLGVRTGDVLVRAGQTTLRDPTDVADSYARSIREGSEWPVRWLRSGASMQGTAPAP